MIDRIICWLVGHYWIKPFDEDERCLTKCIRCGKRHVIMGPVVHERVQDRRE